MRTHFDTQPNVPAISEVPPTTSPFIMDRRSAIAAIAKTFAGGIALLTGAGAIASCGAETSDTQEEQPQSAPPSACQPEYTEDGESIKNYPKLRLKKDDGGNVKWSRDGSGNYQIPFEMTAFNRKILADCGKWPLQVTVIFRVESQGNDGSIKEEFVVSIPTTVDQSGNDIVSARVPQSTDANRVPVSFQLQLTGGQGESEETLDVTETVSLRPMGN